jgi:RNA polymerase sigma-70 factor (ECF subfamily)
MPLSSLYGFRRATHRLRPEKNRMRPEHAFPSTRWSRILQPGGVRDLDALARSYWRPIRAYLAARVRCSEDAANDLVQEAFAWLLASGLLDKADPARGRFRGFLKQSLANFAIEQARRAAATKRGGGVEHTGLDALHEPVDPRARSPEQALDDAWRRELLQHAQELLQRELEQGGRGVHWALFRDYFLAEGDEPDHAALAERHGITKTDVSNWLDHAKRRYRAILRSVVADTVGDEEELQQELQWLFGSAHDAR